MASHRILFAFVAGILIGLAGAAAWISDGSIVPTLPGFGPAGASATTTTPAPESNAISVAAQAAGASVRISSVSVPPPGVWVAVREVAGQDLGNVLGAARVGGSRTDVIIPLLRATVPGTRYAVELYRDDAGSGFDPARNSVYVDGDTGAPAIAYFITK